MTTSTYAISIAQLAANTDVSRATIYRMIKNKCGPKLVRMGRRVLVRPEDAEAWLKQLASLPETATH